MILRIKAWPTQAVPVQREDKKALVPEAPVWVLPGLPGTC